MKFLNVEDELKYSNTRFKLRREIENLFFNNGYKHIEPHMFEDYDDFILLNKRVNKDSMIKVINCRGKISILRPDITTNIIKYILPRLKDNAKLNIFYNSSVFKSVDNLNIKEYRQIGIESLGDDSKEKDINIIIMAIKILKNYSKDFILEIGNTNYIESLLDEIKLNKEEKEELKNIIYRKSIFDLKEYVDKIDIDLKYKETMINILNFQGSFEDIWEKTSKFYMNEKMKKILEELGQINDRVSKESYKQKIHFDLSMIFELDYYEGLIFKGYYKSVNREILSGGRYDKLPERCGLKIPAIGFCISLDGITRGYIKELG